MLKNLRPALRRNVWIGVAGLLALVPFASPPTSSAGGSTGVAISGTKFFVNGTVTYAGTRVEGLLLNSRMVNAIFDDENPETVHQWAYPDTRAWDADRNVDEFVAAVPDYARHGLRAVTIGLQGGHPTYGGSHDWKVSAFDADGSLKPAWLARLDRAVRACDRHGMLVILNLFYQGQDQRLASEAAILRGVDEVVDWLLGQGYGNVLIDVVNESDYPGFDHAILKPARVAELIERIRNRSRGRFPVSTSFMGGRLPPDPVIAASDYVLVHGNGQDADGVSDMVADLRARSAWKADPKPIVFNEDSTSMRNFDTAVAAGASWGYHDKGDDNYNDGFQVLPVNWAINTTAKRTFFDRVAELAGSIVTTPAPPGVGRLMVSRSSDRSAAIALDDASWSGDAYVFLDADPDGIDEVRFYVDDPDATRAAEKVEAHAPYDLAGTRDDAARTAFPYDTSALPDGEHVVTAAVYRRDGGRDLVHASFLVANETKAPLKLTASPSSLTFAAVTGEVAPAQAISVSTSDGRTVDVTAGAREQWIVVTPTASASSATVSVSVDAGALPAGTHTGTVVVTSPGYEVAAVSVTATVAAKPQFVLMVSAAPDRSSPVRLQGATLGGDVYVFLEADPSPIDAVHFYVDNTNATGTPTKVEARAPYDLAGTRRDEERLAYPFETDDLRDGIHTLTAVVHRVDGSRASVTASFATSN